MTRYIFVNNVSDKNLEYVEDSNLMNLKTKEPLKKMGKMFEQTHHRRRYMDFE